MKRMYLLGMAAGLSAIAGSAFAYPTLLGPTGGANLPTASVVAPNTVNLAVDFFDQSSENPNEDIDAAVPIRFLYGVNPNIEIGGTYTVQDGEILDHHVDLDSWGINAKYCAPLVPRQSAWAVGVVHSEFTDDFFDRDFTQLYLVGSKVLARGNRTTPGVRGSLGLNWTTFSNDGDAVRPYFALDIAFPCKASLNFEYQFKDSDVESDALSSVVLRYPFTQNLSGQIGFSNAFRGVVGTDDHDLMAGINLKFGK